MTEGIDSLDDLQALDESELWQIAGDDDHPHQLAAQAILQNGGKQAERTVDQERDTSARPHRDTDDDRSFKDICESIADDDGYSDRVQRLAEVLLTGIKEGRIDG